MANSEQSSPERLAYWYFRLNGFLTIENFIVHPDTGRNQRTDADILAVRFAHRAENLINPMADDPCVSECRAFCNVIIAEVKSSTCALNGPWTRPDDQNIHRVLKSIGCLSPMEIDSAAKALYQKGMFNNTIVTCRLIAVGDKRGQLPIEGVHQIIFNNMIEFIHARFRAYRHQKSSVGNWASDGRRLKNLASSHSERSDFKREARQYFGLCSEDARQ
ncbi:MAG TPA: hypothetical protein VLH56_03055 [Dissulfurispiraceae bacterium]|nr:hypothetical protein [Dissulfurispiraceae bacterium]